MSASEWTRLEEERDMALYHLNELVDAVLYGPSWTVVTVRAERAEKWLRDDE